MKILVCIKQVPETTNIKINPLDNTLMREGISAIINPDDKAGIELALRIKDRREDAEVTVITMGPGEGIKALREAIAMGADDGILITDEVFSGGDTYATALAISEFIKTLRYDLIITGRRAIDGETGQTGPEIAENLGIPQITHCTEFEIEGDKLIAKRQFDDRYHIIEAKMPCLVSIIGEKINPRYMTVRGIFDSAKSNSSCEEKDKKKDKIRVLNYDYIDEKIEASKLGLKGSHTFVKEMVQGISGKNGEKLKGLTEEEAAEAIFQKIIERGFI